MMSESPDRNAGANFTSATSRTRMGVLLRTATTAWLIALTSGAGVGDLSRIRWAAMSMKPAPRSGRAARAASDRSPRVILKLASLRTSGRIWIWRTAPPNTMTCATPGTASSRGLMIQSAVSRKVYGSTWSDRRPIFSRSMVLETSGESFGVPTPAGSVLPNSDSRSEIPCRATCTSTPSANVIVTTERPGIDSERRVASPAAPFTAFSTCLVTSSSTCCGAKPGASVWMSTCDGTNSGNTSRGACSAPQHPRTSASIVSAVPAPKWRTHSVTIARIMALPASWLFGFRTGVGFACQQLACRGDHDLIAGGDTLGDEVALGHRPCRIDFRFDERAGLLLDVTPVLALAQHRRRGGNYHTGHRSADGCPYQQALALPGVTSFEQREEAPPRNIGVGRCVPNLGHLPTLVGLAAADMRRAKTRGNSAGERSERKGHAHQLDPAAGQILQRGVVLTGLPGRVQPQGRGHALDGQRQCGRIHGGLTCRRFLDIGGHRAGGSGEPLGTRQRGLALLLRGLRRDQLCRRLSDGLVGDHGAVARGLLRVVDRLRRLGGHAQLLDLLRRQRDTGARLFLTARLLLTARLAFAASLVFATRLVFVTRLFGSRSGCRRGLCCGGRRRPMAAGGRGKA